MQILNYLLAYLLGVFTMLIPYQLNKKYNCEKVKLEEDLRLEQEKFKEASNKIENILEAVNIINTRLEENNNPIAPKEKEKEKEIETESEAQLVLKEWLLGGEE